MKFAYSVLNEATALPLIQVWIRGPLGERRLRMLVDSGSQWTMVPLGLFAPLGITEGHDIELAGLGGVVVGRLGRAEFQTLAGGWTGQLVGVPSSGGLPPLLGQKGFFDHFLVGFDGRQRSFYVEPA